MNDYYGSNQGGEWSADAYLAHYGVLGMKWGQRRYQNDDGSWTEAGKRRRQAYEYKSWGTKHNEKKAAKIGAKLSKKRLSARKRAALEEKKARYEYRANRSKTLDKREQEYANRVSAKGNIVARLLTKGTVGSKPYQQYLAMMNAQGKGNERQKALAAAATRVGGRVGSTIVKGAYMRRGENEMIQQMRKKRRKSRSA